MRNFTLIFLLLISVCFYSCAELQYAARRQSQTYSLENCKEIYGKWEVYSTYVDLENWRQEYKTAIWIFNEDGTLIVEGATKSFRIEDDCSKLIVGGDSNFYTMSLTKDTLFLFKRSNYSIGSYSISLKKIK